MKKTFIFLLAVLSFSCEKKVRTEITNQNLKETLTQYGKDNPETEVLIETSFGNMRIRLYEDTPLHRANFIKNIKEGIYDDAEFYRIVYQFMIQGGIFPKELGYTVPAEFNQKYIHKRGALSMARGDENNPELESSSSEFYIIHGSKYADYQVAQDAEEFKLNLTPEQKNIYMTDGGYMSLDQQYTVFGEVVEGLEVIEKIASGKVHNVDKPLRKIELKISVVKDKSKD
jgi:peptidyl-prolyl cis-trans isomerase B (cyclophilin B)